VFLIRKALAFKASSSKTILACRLPVARQLQAPKTGAGVRLMGVPE
jgi:hypothetical protein